MRAELRLLVGLLWLGCAGPTSAESPEPERRSDAPSSQPAPLPATQTAAAEAPVIPTVPGPQAPPPTRLSVPGRLAAIGDVHGDLAATTAALRLVGAVDDAGHWTGGDMVVVQTGDQLDRGNDEDEILSLFEREPSAAYLPTFALPGGTLTREG